MSSYLAVEVRPLVDRIQRALVGASRPERAAKERAYLKSDLDHLGVSVPAIRSVVTGVHRDHPDLGHDQLVALVQTLWAVPIHERRAAAVHLLDAYGALLSPADVPLLERLLRESRTWALVDDLAASVLGPLVEREDAALDPVLRRWAVDPDPWIRRASLLAHLVALREGRGNVERFTDLADQLLEDRERFVAKAIGWVLRDTAKRRPELVTAWLLPRAARASRITVREAVKRLPEQDRAAILAAHGVS